MDDASSRGRPLSRAERTVLAVVAALAATYWAACSLLIHRSFHSNGWDLGLIHQVLWNTSYGRVFTFSFRDISYAGSITRILVALEAGGELQVVRQNSEASATEDLGGAGSEVVVAWRPEHTVAVSSASEREER